MHARLKNQKGQSLVEYLLLVALMAIGTIGVIRSLNKTVEVNFANVAGALQGKSRKIAHDEVNESDYKKRDMGNFMSGSANRSSGATDGDAD